MKVNASSESNLLEQLASEFAAAIRAGQQPSVEEYAERNPLVAEKIRETFPMMAMMEMAQEARHTEDAADVLPGLEVNDYRILREVGRGGMGVVYEATQEKLGRSVALKVLPRRLAENPRSVERFYREARAAGQLNHDHIVPIYDVGSDRGLIYFTMRLIEGHSLAELLHELRQMRGQAAGEDSLGEKAVSLWSSTTLAGSRIEGAPGIASIAEDSTRSDSGKTKAKTNFSRDSSVTSESGDPGSRAYFRNMASIAKHIALALSYAHDHGIVHRDIKPSNLLIDKDMHVWVTDFGLAKMEEGDITREGDLVGTIRYMAPEQLSGWADPRSDVYSLGVTLYELLTLKPAFDSQNRAELIKLVSESAPRRLRAIDHGIPFELEAIVVKAIAKNPLDRYANANEMAADLGRYVSGEPVHAAKVNVLQILRMIAYRYRRAFAAIATLLVVVMLTALVATQGNARRLAAANKELSSERERMQRLIYEANVGRAINSFADSDVASCLAIKGRVETETPSGSKLKGLEWKILEAIERSYIPELELQGHQGEVHEFATIPGSSQFISIGDDCTARIWDAVTGKQVKLYDLGFDSLYLPDPDMSAAAIAVSPDAKYFVTGFSSAELYALDTGEHLRTIAKSEEQRTLETVSFVKQGIAAAFRYEDIQVVSLDGKERRVLPGGSRNKFVRQLYDGRLVTCIRYEKGGTKRERIRVWNPNLSEFDEPFRRAEGLRMAVWDWEQRWMAATGHYSSKIRICDSETLEDLDALEVLPQVTDLVYSQDANVLATTHSTGDISLRQLPDRSSVYWPRPNWSVDFNAHESVIHDAGFLPDGRLCTCGGDGLIKIWPKRGLPFKSIDRLGGKAEFPEVSRNGQIALRLGGDGIGQIQIGSADMGRWRTSESEHGFVDFEWLPDGNRIVAGRFNSVCLLDGKTFAVLKEVPHTLGAESHPVCVAVSKSGKRVLSATADLVVLRDENLTELKQTKINCNLEAAFSPDDRLVVTSNRDGEMYCLDGNDLSLQAKWNVVQATRSLCWRTNHELIVGCSGGRVFVWDPTTGQRLFTLEGHYDDVHSLALSDDGQILVSADSRTVRLWSMVTHEPLGILLEEANPVISGLRMLSDQTGILILRGLAQDGPSILVLPLE